MRAFPSRQCRDSIVSAKPVSPARYSILAGGTAVRRTCNNYGPTRVLKLQGAAAEPRTMVHHGGSGGGEERGASSETLAAQPSGISGRSSSGGGDTALLQPRGQRPSPPPASQPTGGAAPSRRRQPAFRATLGRRWLGVRPRFRDKSPPLRAAPGTNTAPAAPRFCGSGVERASHADSAFDLPMSRRTFALRQPPETAGRAPRVSH